MFDLGDVLRDGEALGSHDGRVDPSCSLLVPPWGQGPVPGPLVARGRVANGDSWPGQAWSCCGAADRSDSRAGTCWITGVPLDPPEDQGHRWVPAGDGDAPRRQDLFSGSLEDPGGESPHCGRLPGLGLCPVPPAPGRPVSPRLPSDDQRGPLPSSRVCPCGHCATPSACLGGRPPPSGWAPGARGPAHRGALWSLPCAGLRRLSHGRRAGPAGGGRAVGPGGSAEGQAGETGDREGRRSASPILPLASALIG